MQNRAFSTSACLLLTCSRRLLHSTPAVRRRTAQAPTSTYIIISTGYVHNAGGTYFCRSVFSGSLSSTLPSAFSTIGLLSAGFGPAALRTISTSTSLPLPFELVAKPTWYGSPLSSTCTTNFLWYWSAKPAADVTTPRHDPDFGSVRPMRTRWSEE